MEISSQSFFEDLVKEFPLLRTVVMDEEEFVHFKMERFADYTIDQIKKNDQAELRKCFDFLESRITSLGPELENALNVSYCEALLLGEAREKMKGTIWLMKKKLQAFYLDYEKYYNNLGS